MASPTVHSRDHLEVTESGNALRVQTDQPHLVSLGSGRLSTGITLHPLPDGRTSIGLSDAWPLPDILVQGTGVEAHHCVLQHCSAQGIVTLTPIAGVTTVDGIKITGDVRLSQGSMICIGRSNYFRFNHPQEAKMMKSIFPNTRLSVAPVNFYPAVDNPEYFHMSVGTDKKPPVPPRHSGGSITGFNIQQMPSESPPINDSYSSVSLPRRQEKSNDDFISKICKFELLSQEQSESHSSKWYDNRRENGRPSNVSQKVFPPNASAATCPASMVLYSRRCITPTPYLQQPNKQYQLNSEQMGGSTGSLDNTNGLLNGSYNHRRSQSVGTNLATGTRSSSVPPPCHSRREMGSHHCSMEELQACEEELQFKREKAVKDRLMEQEMERQERARLEEILSLCAEYERQIQLEKQHKSDSPCKSTASVVQQQQQQTNSTSIPSPRLSPSSPSQPMQQNRIKTNGSLPRDASKRYQQSSPGGNKPGTAANVYTDSTVCQRKGVTSSEDELDCIFKFDETMTGGKHQNLKANSLPRHGKSTMSVVNSVVTKGSSPYENVSPTFPQSPRTRIKTIVGNNKVSPNTNEVQNQTISFLGPPKPPRLKQDSNIPNGFTTKTGDYVGVSELQVATKYTSTASYVSNSQSSAFKTNTLPNVSDSTSTNSKLMNGNVRFGNKLSTKDTITKSTNSLYSTSLSEKCSSESKADLIQKEQHKVLCAISSMKRRISEIEQQETEVLRELEMEKALLDGEKKTQEEKLRKDELCLVNLKDKNVKLEQDCAKWKIQEAAKISACRSSLREAELILERLERAHKTYSGSPEDETILLQKLKHHQEILDAERKAFEDLEFHQMEEEAQLETTRDELNKDIADTEESISSTKLQLKEVQNQLDAVINTTRGETCEIEQRKDLIIKELEMEQHKLLAVEGKITSIASNSQFIIPLETNSSLDISSYFLNIDNCHQVTGNNNALLQKDLDHISRITSKPMDTSSGTVGRKASATLLEIERNRQLLLVKQGTMVIEEERKRVQELKKRVQDEVKAQWEERKQREANCQSLNSVGSEDSSVTSSDVLTESASSEDSEKTNPNNLTAKSCESLVDLPQNSQVQMRQKEQMLEQNMEDTRPLSDSSSYDDPVLVKIRDNKSKIQRPLTRYLPVRSENFDLRQHIETAGHQIELCSHVVITASACRGYLQKMGSKFHTWNRRWFVFDRNKRTFMYYLDKTEKKPRGGVYFQAIEEVYVDHLHSVKSPNPKLTFCMKTHDRTYHLLAPSAEAMRMWVDVIFTGAEGYQEFQLLS